MKKKSDPPLGRDQNNSTMWVIATHGPGVRTNLVFAGAAMSTVPPYPSGAPLTKLPIPGGSTDPSGEAAQGNGITPAKVWHALQRRWVVAIPLAAALAALVCWGAGSQLTPIYTARTLVHVGATPPALLFDNLGGRSDPASYQRTQIATVKSRLVRQAVVHDLTRADLAMLRTKPDAVGWLEKEIQADYTVAPEILRITMKGSSPDELVTLLNGVREAYLREVVNKDRGERGLRLQGLTELATKHETTLKNAREKLGRAVHAHGVHEFGEVRAKYERLSNQLATLQTELLLARIGAPRAGVPERQPTENREANNDDVDRLLDRTLETDPVAVGLLKDIQRLEKKITDYERNLLNYQADADYIKSTDELMMIQTRLTRRRESLRSGIVDQFHAGRAPRPQLDRVPEPLDTRARIPLLEVEITKKERELATLAKELAELELVRGEINRHEEQLTLVNSKIRQLEVELQAPSRAHVIEEAVIIDSPKLDRTIKYVGAPAGAVFILVVALIVWLDLRRGAVDGSADLEAARIRVIGAIPSVHPSLLPAFAPPEQPALRREHLGLTDAIDMTRAVIAPVIAATPGYVLAVTSASAGEGKTVLAVHLAVRFARSGLRTLVIDADVRRPQLHRLFGLPPAPGIREWVTGTAKREDVVRSGPVSGLDVISTGEGDTQTVSDILDLRLPELLETVKRDYDVIVLDTAPLLTTPEALAVSRTADGVLLAVMRDASRISGILACAERLASVNARVLGAVVTGDPPPRYYGL